jgi:hypothetical protein
MRLCVHETPAPAPEAHSLPEVTQRPILDSLPVVRNGIIENFASRTATEAKGS